jgi:membrane dipeptidase
LEGKPKGIAFVELPAMIFDAHLDIAWNACQCNRDLSLTVAEIRRFEKQYPGAYRSPNMVSWPELRRGGVGTIVATLLPELNRTEKALVLYQSREAAYAASCGQLAYYRALVARGQLREISDRETLATHVAHWRDSPRTAPIGFILSMEGSASVLSPAQIAEWFAAGLRVLGPAHFGSNRYCHGTGSQGGLTAEGLPLLRTMERVGMILDVTHFSDQSFWDALDIYGGPLLASHHNCRVLVPGVRQLSDDQIEALIRREAVIGAALDNRMLQAGWTTSASNRKTVSLDDVVNHIDHVCQLAGNARHSGLGTDLDGCFGKEEAPGDLDTIADVSKIASILARRGFSQDDIERIMWRNFVDFFLKALPSQTPPTKLLPAA